MRDAREDLLVFRRIGVIVVRECHGLDHLDAGADARHCFVTFGLKPLNPLETVIGEQDWSVASR